MHPDDRESRISGSLLYFDKILKSVTYSHSRMIKHKHLLIGAVVGAYITLIPQVSLPTIGLAEWSVYTPGGNIISHVDGWKERYGDCLRADDSDATLNPEQRQQVYVAHLKRWKYYQDYVIGESNQGFFIFNEIG